MSVDTAPPVDPDPRPFAPDPLPVEPVRPASPAPRRSLPPAVGIVALSLVAGALWPLLLLGAVEFSSVAAASSAAAHLESPEHRLLSNAPVVPLR